LKWYDGGGETGIISKKILEVEVFFSSQNIDFPFYLKRLLELFFFLLFFHAPSLEDSGVLMIFEEKITSSKTTFQMASIYWQWMHIPEWLNHDCGDGRVVDILAVNAYSKVEVCTLIFLGEARDFFWVANHFQKNFKTQIDTSLNKA
jgi:hypothetical protein